MYAYFWSALPNNSHRIQQLRDVTLEINVSLSGGFSRGGSGHK